MIFHWLKLFVLLLGKLLIPPPPAIPDLRIDCNEKCPACGHRRGDLLSIMDSRQSILVQHHCKICGARWHEKTILAAKPGIITPAQLWIQGDPNSSS